MADSSQQQQPPTGRARGRARGVPRTEEEAKALVRKPGEAPTHVPSSGGPTGRGRGLSGERGRGVSVEREAGSLSGPGGRAFHRGSITTPGMASSSVVSPGSDISDSVSTLNIGSVSGSDITRSATASGATEPSIGRGATRGRRDRAPEFLLRTRSDHLETKKGTGGIETKLSCNYFPLISKPNWRLLQYRVDMTP